MSFRTVVIKNRAKLELKLGYLIVRGECEKRVHISEISTLIVETTGAACTSALLCELIKHNVNIIFCDEKHMPHFHITPFASNYASSRFIRQQCSWQEERKAVAWKHIIYNKIFMQANLLEEYGHAEESAMLRGYLSELKDGDITNREGHAAKVYFNALMGQSRRDESLINAKLNYGYTMLLSTVCRDIAAAGYITQLGIWHRNEFNSYNLGSDIMEPFRTIVDSFVFSHIDSEERLSVCMPALMSVKVRISGKEQYFESAVNQYVRNVINFMEYRAEKLPLINEYALK